LRDDVVEAAIGFDDRIVLLKREREIEAVVGRMIEVDCQTRRLGREMAHRNGDPEPAPLSERRRPRRIPRA
jgi:hypothetical protein